MAIPFGINALCVGLVIVSTITFLLFFKYIKKHIGYGWLTLLKDLLPSVLLSLIMGTIVYYTTFYISNIYMKLIAGIIIGIGFYMGAAIILRIKEWKTLIELIKGRIYKQ